MRGLRVGDGFPARMRGVRLRGEGAGGGDRLSLFGLNRVVFERRTKGVGKRWDVEGLGQVDIGIE